ncbi:MAG TPA: hypothetical protein VET85_17330 [Stellaceae bacterium]|nr:hypothetical protein [Stellaceae bacterium]
MKTIAAWPTAGEGYRILFLHIGQFFKLAAGWAACLACCALVKMLPLPSAIAILSDIVTLIVAAVAAAGFGVSWFRAILNDETASGVVPMEFGQRETRYLGYQVAMLLVVGLPAGLLAMLLSAQSWWTAAFAVLHGGTLEPMTLLRLGGGLAVLVPMTIAGIILTPRLMLALPMVALDEPGPLLAVIWRLSKGNTVALFKGWLGCVLPALALWGMLWFELDGAMGPLAAPIVELAGDAFFFIALAASVSFLAYVYAQLAEGRSIAEAGAPRHAMPAE